MNSFFRFITTIEISENVLVTSQKKNCWKKAEKERWQRVGKEKKDSWKKLEES